MKEPDKIEVHKIDIKIGDKTISLKPEQAKELKRILNDMFEEKERVIHEHHWRYWWNYPAYTSGSYCPSWTITSSDLGGTNYTGSVNTTNSTGDTITLALSNA